MEHLRIGNIFSGLTRPSSTFGDSSRRHFAACRLEMEYQPRRVDIKMEAAPPVALRRQFRRPPCSLGMEIRFPAPTLDYHDACLKMRKGARGVCDSYSCSSGRQSCSFQLSAGCLVCLAADASTLLPFNTVDSLCIVKPSTAARLSSSATALPRSTPLALKRKNSG